MFGWEGWRCECCTCSENWRGLSGKLEKLIAEGVVGMKMSWQPAGWLVQSVTINTVICQQIGGKTIDPWSESP